MNEEPHKHSLKREVSRIEIPSTKVNAYHEQKLIPINRNNLTEEIIESKIARVSEISSKKVLKSCEIFTFMLGHTGKIVQIGRLEV